MRKPKLHLALLLCGLTALVGACTKADPLVGKWHFNHGPTVTFASGGEVTSEESGSTWIGRWQRQEDGQLIIDGSHSKAFGGFKTFAVVKADEREIFLRPIEAYELLSGVRVKD